ncbi:phosphotransferase [Shinella yambaruensis]|uniref:Homoserine kinase n=1 Tax=Shinella yambaruensis TaxID=415996 RepID=A0ABQ5ZS66_9HYPH|nr:phosphotransferase [Shinella yambaruensis]MCJ8028928.1 phosphotransferase [Shinella yambaruensis]MCU7981984.1 phosphotransferase [Shinella yambaruensis]GLR54762.1 homoserine kinase [Shinella yambaruensis]
MDDMIAALTARAAGALLHWNLPDQVPELLKYRENAVFKVHLRDGRPAALRLHPPAYHSPAALASELAFMAALREKGIAVPLPIAAPDGSLLAALPSPAPGEPHYADLIDWMEGEPLGDTGAPLPRGGRDLPALFGAIGREMARLHDAADAFVRPAGFERPAWDVEGLLGEAPFWGRFWDCPVITPVQRDALARLRARLLPRFSALAPGLDYGLIHADLVRENVLVAGGAVAFIDFDDCGFGFRLFDLATALLRNRHEPDYPQLRAALLEGYAAVRPQAEAEFRHLPLFLLLRALTYIGWAAARPELPDNPARLQRYLGDMETLARDLGL